MDRAPFGRPARSAALPRARPASRRLEEMRCANREIPHDVCIDRGGYLRGGASGQCTPHTCGDRESGDQGSRYKVGWTAKGGPDSPAQPAAPPPTTMYLKRREAVSEAVPVERYEQCCPCCPSTHCPIGPQSAELAQTGAVCPSTLSIDAAARSSRAPLEISSMVLGWGFFRDASPARRTARRNRRCRRRGRGWSAARGTARRRRVPHVQ